MSRVTETIILCQELFHTDDQRLVSPALISVVIDLVFHFFQYLMHSFVLFLKPFMRVLQGVDAIVDSSLYILRVVYFDVHRLLRCCHSVC